jgi:hypothetical protein
MWSSPVFYPSRHTVLTDTAWKLLTIPCRRQRSEEVERQTSHFLKQKVYRCAAALREGIAAALSLF